MLDNQYGIDERFPQPSKPLRWFLSAYPLAAIVAYLVEFRIPSILVTMVLFVGMGWLLLLINAAIVLLQRAGYAAAVRDFTSLRIAELAAQGLLPPDLQKTINEEIAKQKGNT